MNLGHVLVFGGTGMLSKATAWIVEHATQTTVFGRNFKRLLQIKKNSSGNKLEVRELDYTNISALKDEIKYSFTQYGPIDMVVSWIHGTAPEAIPTIKQQISQLQNKHWTFLHVKGSSSNLDSIVSKEKTHSEQYSIKEVRLGFIYNDTFSRWLTNEEISNGVIQAIKNEKQITTIGTLYPWEKRP